MVAVAKFTFAVLRVDKFSVLPDVSECTYSSLCEGHHSSAMTSYLRELKQRAGTKFIVLLALLTVFLAWRVGTASHNVPYYMRNHSSQAGERSSAFSVRRGISVETAVRRDPAAAAAAEIAIIRKEAQIIRGLGEGGVAVHLGGKEAQLASEIEAVEAFNLFLSDQISLHRSLPDGRHYKCHDWNECDNLPTASVVIVFHNEPRSTLLRTIHSVVNRSPKRLLREVILVDDFSDRPELQYELDYYLLSRFGGLVRRVRLPRRWGLVRARLVGAHAAKGEVLVFLDAHCEVTEQWLEPLLEHVQADRRAVAVPIIDIIDAHTLEYKPRHPCNFTVGGFKWDGHYDWIPVPPAELRRRRTADQPTRTPVMAGGLFAMNREYFWEVGSYDERMDLWGGENLEMSFRVWMCGGSISVIPCSRVGHIFRTFSPYTFPDNKDSHGINTARLAHVWMDDYKRLLFLNRPDLEHVQTGDLSSRMELRKRLQCRSFRWYLENIYPQKFIAYDHAHAYGKVRPRAVAPHLCVQTYTRGKDDSTLIVDACYSDHRTPQQIFALSARGELRSDTDCVELAMNGSSSALVTRKLTVTRCSTTNKPSQHQEWEYTPESQIRHKMTGLCIEAKNITQNSEISVNTCTKSLSQVWTFENFYHLDENKAIIADLSRNIK